MTAEVLKHTQSLSPLTLQPIDAEIILDGENICMVKKDEEGREYKTLVEKDKNLYSFLTKLSGDFSAKTKSVNVYVSSKCNLNCQVCYEKYGNDQEVSLKEIKELSENFKDCNFSITGMEPTCRADIFETIKMVRNNHTLVTNGIKLASLDYVQKLKKYGLNRIFFSFNGFNDEIYQKMNGGNLLETKLKALKNIELEGIDTLISVTVSRNINENQILPLIRYCFEHRSFIIELRLRTITAVGKHLDAEQILLSELMQLVADSLHIDKKDILMEFGFIQLFIEQYGWLLPKGFRDKYGAKLCSFIFHIKKEKNGGYSSPGSIINLDKINNSIFKSVYMFYYLFKAYGPILLMETLLNVLNLRRFVVQKKMLNVTLKCWPNIYNIDLAEMNKCPTVYYKNGNMEKFCLSNIKDSVRKEKK